MFHAFNEKRSIRLSRGFFPQTQSKLRKAVVQNSFIRAAYTNNIPEIKKCLEAGANPNYLSTEYGLGALHFAAQRGDILLARYLLKLSDKTDINIINTHCHTPLYRACIFSRVNFVKFLLTHGADPNIPDTAGRTPLHIAIRANSIQNIVHLIQYDADKNAMDDFEQTPLSLCLLDYHSMKAATILLAHGVDFQTEEKRRLHIFFECVLQCKNFDDTKYVTILLDHGIDVNILDPATKRNCLHFVGFTGCLCLAILLVEKGANRFVVDFTGRTPAMVAKDHQHLFLYDFFVKGYRPPNILIILKYVKKWRDFVKRARPCLARLKVDDNDDEYDVGSLGNENDEELEKAQYDYV